MVQDKMNTTVQGHQAVGGATKRPPPDTSVPVPPGVKAQADRANALIEQAKAAKAANEAAGGNELVTPNVPPARPNPGVVTANFDPNNPNPPTDVPGDARDSRIQSQPTPPPQPPFTPPPAPQPPQPQSEADWEHQFKSLKGRYDRDQENTRRMQQTLQDQQRLLAQIGNAPQQTAPSLSGEGSGVRFNITPPPPGRFVKQNEVQEYGSELMDVVGRRAAEVYESFLPQLTNELNQVRRQIGGVQNTVVFDARVKMYDDLAAQVPNWRVINDSPQFAQWLDQIDPISHRTRREFLNGAHNSNQASNVIDIFNTFLHDMGVAPQQSNGAGSNGMGNGAGNPQGNPPPPQPQLDLMQFAAPGRAKTGQTQVPQDKPIVTRAEIKQFYTDKTQGKYAGRDDEAAAIERQIFEAGNEGRIR